MAKHPKQRRRTSLIAVLLVMILLAAYVSFALWHTTIAIAPVYVANLRSETTQKVVLNWPSYGEAAIGAAGYGVLASQGEQKALPTASIAKVITALAVLKQRPLQTGEQGPTITITQADVDTYNQYVAQDGSVVPVTVGEQISEYQALQALLLPSANNMADTLARWAFGSVNDYLTFANNFTKQLSLKSVVVTDPSGLKPTTVASAQDLTVLGELAMLDPVFAEIVAQTDATIPVAGSIHNYNGVLGQDGNVGIKTGNNDQNKGAYLFAVKQQVGTSTITIVGAITGGPDLRTVLKDSMTLVASAKPHFKQTTFVTAGQPVATYVSGKQTITARATQDITLICWDGNSFSSRATLDSISVTTKANTNVGTIAVRNSSTASTTSSAVKLDSTLQPVNWSQRLLHPF